MFLQHKRMLLHQAAPISSGVQPYSVVMVPGLTEQGPLQDVLAQQAAYPRQQFTTSVPVGSGAPRRAAPAVSAQPTFSSFEQEMPCLWWLLSTV